MLSKYIVLVMLVFGLTVCQPVSAQEDSKPTEENTEPAELVVLKDSIGVWDAEFEVWPNGPDKPSAKFKGVETNRAYGKHWIASDLESEFMGQKIELHSIIGYDLDKKKLVGKIIDQGPYAASMTGEHDPKKKSTVWTVKAKGFNGKPMLQRTTITQTSATERTLLATVPGEKEGEYVKMMQIKFVKRKK